MRWEEMTKWRLPTTISDGCSYWNCAGSGMPVVGSAGGNHVPNLAARLDAVPV